jgi:hypothetical protein
MSWRWHGVLSNDGDDVGNIDDQLWSQLGRMPGEPTIVEYIRPYDSYILLYFVLATLFGLRHSNLILILSRPVRFLTQVEPLSNGHGQMHGH